MDEQSSMEAALLSLWTGFYGIPLLSQLLSATGVFFFIVITTEILMG